MTQAVLTTARLTLRRLTHDDAPFLVTLLNDPDFIRYIADRQVRTVADACRYLDAGPGAMYERYGFGLWLVVLTASGESIGICGLLKREVLDDVDLGFAFLPAFRSQGCALEAARGSLDYARDVLGLSRVVAVAQPDNERSHRLLAKLGFVREGVTRLAADGPELALFVVALAIDESTEGP
jgi:RimJ/RimL family protein N-acetyltransferase